MSIRVQTNTLSMNAQNHLRLNGQAENNATERLSSGLRVNHAGDDAAALAIATRIGANTRSMRQALRNAQDGISMIQVAEGSQAEIGNMLIRMRELSIQAASDTIGDDERRYLNAEVNQLVHEVDRISHTTEFNGQKLQDATAGIIDVQVGIQNDPAMDRFYYDVLQGNTTVERLGIGSVDISDKDRARGGLATIDTAIDKVLKNRVVLGAMGARLQSVINNGEIYDENLTGARSRMIDADMAVETSELTRAKILVQSNISVLSQANSSGKIALQLLGA